MNSLADGKGTTSLKTGLSSLRTGVTSLSSLRKGVPVHLVINGIAAILLYGADGAPLKGADGAYLYGVA